MFFYRPPRRMFIFRGLMPSLSVINDKLKRKIGEWGERAISSKLLLLSQMESPNWRTCLGFVLLAHRERIDLIRRQPIMPKIIKSDLWLLLLQIHAIPVLFFCTTKLVQQWIIFTYMPVKCDNFSVHTLMRFKWNAEKEMMMVTGEVRWTGRLEINSEFKSRLNHKFYFNFFCKKSASPPNQVGSGQPRSTRSTAPKRKTTEKRKKKKKATLSTTIFDRKSRCAQRLS